MKRILFFVAILIIAGCSGRTAEKSAYILNSPDGRLTADFYLSEDGIPSYNLFLEGREVITDSRLGYIIRHEGGVNNITIFENEKNLNGLDMTRGFTVKSVTTSSQDDAWKPVWGEMSEIRNHYNEMAVTLLHDSIREVVIRFRLFDDGLGFRYEFPKQEKLNYFIIGQEKTEFNLAEDYTTFWIAGDYDANEFLYETTPASQIIKKYPFFDRAGNSCVYPMPVPGVQTPVMMKSQGGGLYVNIHEAALDNYSSMQLEVQNTLKGAKFTSHLIPDPLGNRGYMQTPCTSPWRTIIAVDNAPAVLESKMILNLNEPCAIAETDWIRPQKFMGVWFEMFLPGFGTWAYSSDPNVKIGVTDFASLPPTGRHAANTENVKKYIDFASRNGIQGLLVEGWDIGWEDWAGQYKEHVFDFTTPYPDFDVDELERYAKKKCVQLVMHHETSGAAGNYERYLDRAYAFMNKHNYSVVKSGYVGPIMPRGEFHYGQAMVNHYLHCIRRAADYRIMIDAHEPVRPTGMHRTYPNYLAAESGRGTEFETFFEKGNSPEHTTIMPFTRLMGGPMDYTPGIFEQKMSYYGDHTSKARVHTTLIKQLALYVTMYSPLQMVADIPENYDRFPDAFQFIKDVPTDWDYSKVLEAEPGDYITIARRAKGGDCWFIGAITDENPRTATIDLSRLSASGNCAAHGAMESCCTSQRANGGERLIARFGLDANKKYEAIIYSDGSDAHWDDNPQSYVINRQIVTSESVLKVNLAPGGGCAIELRPVGK